MLMIDPGYKAITGNLKVSGGTWSAASAQSYNITTGMYSEVSPFPIAIPQTTMTLNGSTSTVYPHIYGSLTIAGTDLFLSAANGPVGDDIMNVNPALGGSSYVVHTGNLTGTGLSQLSSTNANYGGVTVVHASTASGSTDFVVGQELAKISNTAYLNSVNNSVGGNGTAIGTASPQSALNPMGSTTKGQSTATMMNFIRRLWSSP